jgi:large subunit ribosomal protein L49
MYLKFLRPLGPPRSSIIARFLSTSAPNSTTTPPSPPSQPTSTSTVTKPTPLPYRVNRTPSSYLPIYTLAKRGGNLKLTKVRKIEGDINTLRSHLLEALQLGEKEIEINRLTNHIIIKASHRFFVYEWLHVPKFKG